MTGEYLTKSNWPECIPWMGPKREYGPYPWGEKIHSDPHGLDEYPASHPDAGSIGETYLGDVCPYCGVPLDWMNDEVVTLHGDRGVMGDLFDLQEHIPCYHPKCWSERNQQINHRITDFEAA